MYLNLFIYSTKYTRNVNCGKFPVILQNQCTHKRSIYQNNWRYSCNAVAMESGALSFRKVKRNLVWLWIRNFLNLIRLTFNFQIFFTQMLKPLTFRKFSTLCPLTGLAPDPRRPIVAPRPIPSLLCKPPKAIPAGYGHGCRCPSALFFPHFVKWSTNNL